VAGMAGSGIVAISMVVLMPALAHATQTHMVHSGETLWTIAARYQVSVDAIVSTNHLADPNFLAQGQRLVIPGPPRRAGPAVQPTTPRVTTTSSPSRGERWESAMTTRALRLVGIRYLWGGSTPNGFDCSGFVNYVLGSMGVRVPRTSYAMYEAGQPIMRGSLQVGDIVFFQTVSPGPSHAGIYLGHSTFIHASSASGRVTLTSLDDRYYSPRFLGARRI